MYAFVSHATRYTANLSVCLSVCVYKGEVDTTITLTLTRTVPYLKSVAQCPGPSQTTVTGIFHKANVDTAPLVDRVPSLGVPGGVATLRRQGLTVPILRRKTTRSNPFHLGWGVRGYGVTGLGVTGFRFRVEGFRVLGFRVLGFRVLVFRVRG
jgi:hypothetical protein